MQKYEVLFFDLDHTLWDYEKNSTEALSDLYTKYKLEETETITLDLFLKTFEKVNSKLWNNYNKGHIGRDYIREKRFLQILDTFGIRDEKMSNYMSEEYLNSCPQKTHLFPHTFEVLNYLKERYRLFILTNGFNDVQKIKITNSKLDTYFEGMITSDSSGHRKPSKEIFDYAMLRAKTQNHQSLMIGDNLTTDIKGAQSAEIDAVFFNPQKNKHKASINYEIDCLSQLMDIL